MLIRKNWIMWTLIKIHICGLCMSQLPHSYYFTICILVLKFANKGVFFEEIQDSHFPRKRGYSGTHLRECGEKGVNFDVQCFTLKKRVHLGWKVSVLLQKRGSFWTEKSVLYHEKGVVLSCPVSVLPQNKGSFSNWRTRMGTTFFSEWESRAPDVCIISDVMHVWFVYHVDDFWTKYYLCTNKIYWQPVNVFVYNKNKLCMAY